MTYNTDLTDEEWILSKPCFDPDPERPYLYNRRLMQKHKGPSEVEGKNMIDDYL